MTQIKDLVESREYLMPQLPMMQQIEENLQTDYESAVAVFNEVVAPKLEQPEKRISQLDLQAFEASSTEDIAIKNAHALFRNSPGAFDQYGICTVEGYFISTVNGLRALIPAPYYELLLSTDYLPSYFRSEWANNQIMLKQLLVFYNIAKQQQQTIIRPKLNFAKDRDSNKELDSYKDQIKFLERQMAKLEQKQQMIALASDPNLAELYKGLQSKYNVMMEAAEKDRKEYSNIIETDRKDYRNIIAKKDAALMELNSQLSEARKACKELKQGAEAFAKDITKLRNELAFVGLRCEQYEDEIKPIITVENEEIQVTGRKYRPVKRSVKPKIA